MDVGGVHAVRREPNGSQRRAGPSAGQEADLPHFSRSILAQAAHPFSPRAPRARPWRGTASGSLLGDTNSSMGDRRELDEEFLPLQRAKLFNAQEISDP